MLMVLAEWLNCWHDKVWLLSMCWAMNSIYKLPIGVFSNLDHYSKLLAKHHRCTNGPNTDHFCFPFISVAISHDVNYGIADVCAVSLANIFDTHEMCVYLKNHSSNRKLFRTDYIKCGRTYYHTGVIAGLKIKMCNIQLQRYNQFTSINW